MAALVPEGSLKMFYELIFRLVMFSKIAPQPSPLSEKIAQSMRIWDSALLKKQIMYPHLLTPPCAHCSTHPTPAKLPTTDLLSSSPVERLVIWFFFSWVWIIAANEEESVGNLRLLPENRTKPRQKSCKHWKQPKEGWRGMDLTFFKVCNYSSGRRAGLQRMLRLYLLKSLQLLNKKTVLLFLSFW